MNNGLILSKTTTIVLNNDTLVVDIGSIAELNATIEEDNHNNIVPVSAFNLIVNTTNVDSAREDKYQKGTYNCNVRGIYTVSAVTTGLMDNELKNGTLEVKVKSSIKLSVDQTNEGEKVVITAEIDPSVTGGNATFIVPKTT
jgi:hypothetical protein